MTARNFFAWKMIMVAHHQDKRNHLRKQRADFRTSFNPVEDLNDTEFRNRYRLSKEAFLLLCQELEELTNLRSTQRVKLQTKVLVALLFYATGSYQRPVGAAKGLSQKICSVYIHEVTQALTHDLIVEKYIQFPKTPAARQAIIQRYYSKFGIPGVIGCIDGSHFRIHSPPVEEEHLYYCRKKYHSINVQMVCDSDCRIINVNSNFGGAYNDSFIWENSQINSYMQSLHAQGEIYCLLGDSGYPLRPWLMTTYLEVTEDSPEAIYNQKHTIARVLIENTFGHLKNLWRCLCKDRVLHYKPKKCAQIIQACCVLYNIALDYGVPEPDDLGQNEGEQPAMDNNIRYDRDERTTTDLIRGGALRDRIAQQLHN